MNQKVASLPMHGPADSASSPIASSGFSTGIDNAFFASSKTAPNPGHVNKIPSASQSAGGSGHGKWQGGVTTDRRRPDSPSQWDFRHDPAIIGRKGLCQTGKVGSHHEIGHWVSPGMSTGDFRNRDAQEPVQNIERPPSVTRDLAEAAYVAQEAMIVRPGRTKEIVAIDLAEEETPKKVDAKELFG